MISTELIIYAIVVYLMAGVIKGTTGIGLPTAAIGILSQFIEPRMAISLVIFPILISNAWQVFREGKVVETFITYWRLALALMLVLIMTTFVTARIDTEVLMLILGVVIFLFAASSLLVKPKPIPQRFDQAAQIFAGTTAGILGGLTAIWAPPIVIYLTARGVEKNDFVRVTGVLLFVGGVSLCIGFWQAGLLTSTNGLFSLGLVIPTLLGFSLGEVLRRRLNAERFRTLVLMIFLIMGLNLIRKAIL